MKKTCLLLVALFAWPVAAADAPAPKTEEEKLLYAIGLALAQQVSQFDLSEAELQMVERGLRDATLGRDRAVDLQAYGPKINAFVNERIAKRSESEKAKGRTYLEEQAKRDGAVRTDSGMIFIEQAAGVGPSPTETSQVEIHYTGKFVDGKVFDTSREDDEPARFTLRGVVPCFREGLMRMKVGGKATLVCPSDIAYGDRGSPPIPPGATIVFDIELISMGTPSQPSNPG